MAKTNPIEKYLKDVGISQQQFSRDLGVAPALVSEWRRDYKHPGLRMAFALEDTTGGAIPARSWLKRKLVRG